MSTSWQGSGKLLIATQETSSANLHTCFRSQEPLELLNMADVPTMDNLPMTPISDWRAWMYIWAAQEYWKPCHNSTHKIWNIYVERCLASCHDFKWNFVSCVRAFSQGTPKPNQAKPGGETPNFLNHVERLIYSLLMRPFHVGCATGTHFMASLHREDTWTLTWLERSRVAPRGDSHVINHVFQRNARLYWRWQNNREYQKEFVMRRFRYGKVHRTRSDGVGSTRNRSI